ncbi:MAG: hypothetical protein GKS05_02730 [Nitrospirales bacterium]|nr:hypothetical protein [Nitrospirales bacterium]
MIFKRSLFFSLSLVLSGCAGLSGAPTVTTVCSFDQAWGVALTSVSEFELRKIDEEGGTIETDWIAVSSRTAGGPLKRNVNQERLRFFVNLEAHQTGTSISVHQAREFFSPYGVQSQSQAWRRIPAVPEEEQRLVNRIHNKLEAKGC